jgi:hypothetical protein
MESSKIVVFQSPGTDPALLSRSLEALEECAAFQLPSQSDTLSDVSSLKSIADLKPHVVLLDIVDGYDYASLCNEILAHSAEPPTILGILGKDLEENATNTLSKYPIDSYLGAEWSIERTLDKITSFTKLKRHNAELKAQVETTTDTAMTAMKAASEIGLLMQLVEWLQPARSTEDVANCLFRLCNSTQLNAYVLILDNGQESFFPNGAVHESAKKIMREALHSDIRVLSKNRILVFRLDYLVLVVTNAPWEDQETYGRLRDILLQGAALAEAKARTITVNNLIISQHSQVNSIMELIKSVSAETQMYAREIMKTLSDELQIAAMTLDLTEDQEGKLMQLSNEAFESIEVLYQNSDALEQHFHTLITSITAVAELTKNSSSETPPDPMDDDDVELF